MGYAHIFHLFGEGVMRHKVQVGSGVTRRNGATTRHRKGRKTCLT